MNHNVHFQRQSPIASLHLASSHSLGKTLEAKRIRLRKQRSVVSMITISPFPYPPSFHFPNQLLSLEFNHIYLR